MSACSVCRRLDCQCTPPVFTATGFDGQCEGCSRPIRAGERIYLYDDGPVVHVECPEGVKA